ncbi:tetratricopeptide repeat protein [Mucilaginibacter sp. AW1-3]
MKKQLILMPALLLIAGVALCQSNGDPLPLAPLPINNNDMEHQMRADQQVRREQSYEQFGLRASGAAESFNTLGLLAAKQGNYVEALKQFNEAITSSKYYSGAYYNRGLVKLKLYHKAEALDDFNMAVSLEPGSITYISKVADTKLDMGDLTGAISDYNKVIDIRPANAHAWLQKGIAERKLKQDDAALADLTKARQLGSIVADSLLKAISPGTVAKLVVASPDTNVNNKNARKAAEPYISYTGPLSKSAEATQYNGIALDFAHANNMPAAIRNFTLAIAADPDFVSAYNNRGFAELIMHQYRDAVGDYKKAIALDPKAVNAYTNCANAMYEMKDYGGALKYFDLSLQLDSTNVVNYGNRGVIKRITHDAEGAIEDFDQCLKLDPLYTQALINKALAEVDLKRNSAACTDLIKAKNLGNKNADALISKYCY